MNSSWIWNFPLLTLVALFGFVPSTIFALGVDWSADKHPTHTLDHITAVLSGSSSSKVNVVLYTYNHDTNEGRNIVIANNVPASGSYTIQVPNNYVGTLPSGKTVSQYFARELYYQTRALDTSSGAVLGQSDDFIIFWDTTDGTPTPTPFSSASSSSSSSGSGGSSSGSSGSQSSGSKSSASGSSGSSGSSSSSSSSSSSGSSSNSDTNKGSSDTSSQGSSDKGGEANNAAGSQINANVVQSSSAGSTSTIISQNNSTTNVVISTAPAVTISGTVVPGSTFTITSSAIAGAITPNQAASASKSMTGPIVGAVIGALILIALLGWLAIWCCRRRNRARRPTAGEALAQPRKLPEAGIITPAVWNARNNDNNRPEISTKHLEALQEEGRMSPDELTGYPILNRRLSGETLSGEDVPTRKGAISPSEGASTIMDSPFHHGDLFVPPSTNPPSARTSWYTVGQFPPPPEYSRRQSERRTSGAVDPMMAHVA